MTKERTSVESRLASELDVLNAREAEEAERLESERGDIEQRLRVAESGVTSLTEQLAKAKRQVAELTESLSQHGPQESAITSQRMRDRIAVIGRVVQAESHELTSMVNAFSTYRAGQSRVASAEEQDPTIRKDREFVAELATGSEHLQNLPDVVRSVLLERAEEARKRLESIQVPERPAETGVVFAGESPIAGEGYLYIMVVPCTSDASEADSQHSHLFINAVAAMCETLRHRPGIKAPSVSSLPDKDYGLVVCMLDADVPEDERGLFALGLDEQVSRNDWPYSLAVEPLDDHLLRKALANLTCGVDVRESY